jgi:iron(III) transport system substrate-binding protein
MRAEKGDDATRAWLKGMADNEARSFANNTAIVQAVGRGEIDMGLANHYYNVRAKKDDPNVKSENYFFPDRDLGSLLLVTAASITRSSQNVPEAEKLVQFLLSEASQRYFADETQEYPLAAGVAPSDDLPPLSSIQADTVDYAELGSLEETIAMIKESGLTA